MQNYTRSFLVILAGLSLIVFSHCGDDDVTGTCAGCPDDAVWSVFGSEECYKTIEECEAAEKGDCVICN